MEEERLREVERKMIESKNKDLGSFDSSKTGLQSHKVINAFVCSE